MGGYVPRRRKTVCARSLDWRLWVPPQPHRYHRLGLFRAAAVYCASCARSNTLSARLASFRARNLLNFASGSLSVTGLPRIRRPKVTPDRTSSMSCGTKPGPTLGKAGRQSFEALRLRSIFGRSTTPCPRSLVPCRSELRATEGRSSASSPSLQGYRHGLCASVQSLWNTLAPRPI